MSARTAFPDSLDPTTLWALRAVLVPMHPTIASHPDLKAITVFLASITTPERGGLPYLDAVLPAAHRLAATHVVRDLGALPPDAILYLLAQPLLDLASDQLMRDRDLTTRYEGRFEVEDRAPPRSRAAGSARAHPASSATPPTRPRCGRAERWRRRRTVLAESRARV